jgi:hypothetical protein
METSLTLKCMFISVKLILVKLANAFNVLTLVAVMYHVAGISVSKERYKVGL